MWLRTPLSQVFSLKLTQLMEDAEQWGHTASLAKDSPSNELDYSPTSTSCAMRDDLARLQMGALWHKFATFSM